MKKILIISGQYPIPENSGNNIRTMNFVRFFRRHGRVDLAYSFMRSSVDPFKNEYFLERKARSGKRGRILNIIRGVPEGIQYTTFDDKKLMELIYREQYDIIFVRYIVNTGGLFSMHDKYKRRVIVDYDDMFTGSLSRERIKLSTTLYSKLIHIVDRESLIRYEKKCSNFGASIFSLENDVEKMIQKTGKTNIYHIPNIYNNESYKSYDFKNAFHYNNVLLFVATLNYLPNVSGLQWFVSKIFPFFRRKYPDAKLLVVGRSPNDTVKELCRSTQNIELYSDVEDLKAFYEQCRVVIVPLLIGSGTRIKILEAALTSRPILSTPVGSEGLELDDGRDLLLFKDKDSFVSQYERLCVSDFYNAIIRNAKNTVKSKYSSEAFNTALDEVLKNFLLIST